MQARCGNARLQARSAWRANAYCESSIYTDITMATCVGVSSCANFVARLCKHLLVLFDGRTRRSWCVSCCRWQKLQSGFRQPPMCW
mmetsp:Transcript_142576/g.455029  ORF Transcript_142576/g.455029 Transcript_142576/m.455029 type:complete len:86 (-) Transcript_142576:465-722(-)